MKKMLFLGAVAAAAMILPVQADDAKANYDKNCAMCHGKDGKAATPMGKKLSLKDWTDAKVQGELKDDAMAKAIKEGVKDGDKVKMKAYDKLSDEEIKALVAYIRALKK